ncbi:MAG: D-alanine--D-alanine ligase [Nitrospirota bacterium]|nr:D-alanine--D-alanine ligase [Nitrospirota bacterium]
MSNSPGTGSAPLRFRHVAVLLGGRSSEREISLTSGRAAAEALRSLGYRVTEVDAADDLPQKLREAAPEAAFIALHGRLGEDGTVQGLLEVMGIPYTGSGVLASAAAADKLATKRLMAALGVPTPAYEVLTPATGSIRLPYPVVVKPVIGGSSIGVHYVKDAAGLAAAVSEAFAQDSRAYAEAAVTGREVTVSVLDGEPLPIVEVVAAAGMFTFEAKYKKDSGTRYLVPAELPASCSEAVSKAAVAAYTALGCRGAARVDVMLDANLSPWVLEVNTIPGMTPTSLLPKAARAVGVSFEQLIGRMMHGATLDGAPAT